MPRLFSERPGFAGVFLDTLGGTIAGSIGIYVGKRLWDPLNQFLGKFLGTWSGFVGALIIALILNYLAENQEGMIGNGLRVMAYGLAGWGLAHALGWNPNPRVVIQRVSPWSTLEPIPLGRP